MIINNNLNFYLIILIIFLVFYFLFNNETFINVNIEKLYDSSKILNPKITEPTHKYLPLNKEYIPQKNSKPLFEIQDQNNKIEYTNILKTQPKPDVNVSTKIPIVNYTDMICPENYIRNDITKKCYSKCNDNDSDIGTKCIKTLTTTPNKIDPTLVLNSMVNNICLSGLIKNENKCFSCPDTYDYDSSSNLCIKCPDTYTYNNNKCYKDTNYNKDNINFICPKDYFYDTNNNKCIKYICTEPDYEYNIKLDKCIKCPENFVYDSDLNICKSIDCPHNFIYENNVCISYQCPSNYYFDNKEKICKIIDTTKCNKNSIYDNNTNKCLKCNGKIIDTICYNQLCNNNDELYKINNELKCVACPDNYLFDASLNLCVSKNIYCNDNSISKNCFECPPEYKYNKELNKCIKHDCLEENIIDDKCYKCDRGRVKKDSTGVNCYSCPDNFILQSDFTCKIQD